MSDLLRRPRGERGKVHDVTPENANWGYVGFELHRLEAGDKAEEALDGEEAILVLVEGKGAFRVDDRDFGEIGGRMDLFSRDKPHSLYVPPGARWRARATTPLCLAVCKAPSRGGGAPRHLRPDDVVAASRGTGTNLRHIHDIAMVHQDVADSLLVTEVFTPAGHWSSYPPHRHDEDDPPRITYLEETYYHRLNPTQGFAFQRVFTEDGELDETIAVHDHDVVLVPKGHHPCGAPHGYDLYYLNVMAGPSRQWIVIDHPDHAWIKGAPS